jgi:hypothetical protein
VGVVIAALLLGLVLGGLGKVLGLTIARLRFRRSCNKILHMMNKV